MKKISVRALLVGTGLLAGGLVAGPVLFGTTHRAPVVHAIRDGQTSYFVAIDSYRTMDTRIESPVAKVERTKDNALGGLPVARYVQFELNGPNTIEFPDDAVAVTFNVTVTQTEGAGFVQIDGYSYADGSSSTVNWSSSGQTVANSGVARLTTAFDDPGALGVFLGGAPGAKAHVVIDITGYYMPVVI